ncbi:MAG: hypothetical protein L6Q76_10655 [Polyangiaceae bacterium]|nr:hypothetical protein [Polyangiaceae bacterium]
MTYRPEGSVSFNPPFSERILSYGYLLFALAVSGVIVYGQNAPSNSWIFHYVVEGDRNRLISSSVCAIILFCSALAAVLREQMRGVIVHPDGIEMRELLPLGWPRVKRVHWSQIDRVFVPSSTGDGAAERAHRDTPDAKGRTIRLDLWDGSTAWVPRVADVMGLAMLLEKVALARAIPIVGSTGLVDDLGNPRSEGEASS